MKRRSPTDVQVQDYVRPNDIDVIFYLRGPIDVLELEDGSQMLINAEGQAGGELNLPINWEAVCIAKQAIFGPALILKGPARYGKSMQSKVCNWIN